LLRALGFSDPRAIAAEFVQLVNNVPYYTLLYYITPPGAWAQLLNVGTLSYKTRLYFTYTLAVRERKRLREQAQGDKTVAAALREIDENLHHK